MPRKHCTVHVVRLVDVPHLTGMFDSHNLYRVVALDSEQELGRTHTSDGFCNNHGKQTVNFGFEGTLRLCTAAAILRLRVERADGQWSGICDVDRLDPRSATLRRYSLVSKNGTAMDCSVEVLIDEGHEHLLGPSNSGALSVAERELEATLHHQHASGRKLVIHILRLLDMPRWHCHLFGHPTDFRICVMGENGDVEAQTRHIEGKENGPDRQTIELHHEIPLEVTTEARSLELRVECTDGHLVGKCRIATDRPYSHKSIYTLTDACGAPLQSCIELFTTQHGFVGHLESASLAVSAPSPYAMASPGVGAQSMHPASNHVAAHPAPGWSDLQTAHPYAMAHHGVVAHPEVGLSNLHSMPHSGPADLRADPFLTAGKLARPDVRLDAASGQQVVPAIDLRADPFLTARTSAQPDVRLYVASGPEFVSANGYEPKGTLWFSGFQPASPQVVHGFGQPWQAQAQPWQR